MKRSQGVGSIANTIKRIIIRIDTDSAISGYGEAAHRGRSFLAQQKPELPYWQTIFGRRSKGQKVADIPKIMKACDRAAVGHPEAKAAIEMALYDIVGKASDLPIYQLLVRQGKRQDTPFSFSIANPDLEADLELTSRMYEEGSRIFKIKTGFVEDHDEDVRRVARIREHLPDDTDLRIDYNQGLPAFGALQKLKQMEEFRPTFLEQPVKAHLWDVMADLTANLVTPILADESVFNAAFGFRCGSAQDRQGLQHQDHESGRSGQWPGHRIDRGAGRHSLLWRQPCLKGRSRLTPRLISLSQRRICHWDVSSTCRAMSCLLMNWRHRWISEMAMFIRQKARGLV